MSPDATCPACGRNEYECFCTEACAVCGMFTNHGTAEHEVVLFEQREEDGDL